MNTLRHIRKTALLIVLGIAAGFQSASALTYTAIASGNFSSNLTWTGGLAPSLLNASDVIIIPSGITVNLDQNVTFNGSTCALTLYGNLTSSTGKALVLTSTTFTGSGSIIIDSMAIATTSGFGFTGTITTQKLNSTGASIAAAASITVSNSLSLASGTLVMAAGSLNFISNATIVVKGGSMISTGGTINLGNAYNVRYEGSGNLLAGLELNGSGLNNVDLNTSSSAGVALSSDLNIKGTLTLASGTLRLNGRNLSFTGDGNFSASGSGYIASSAASNLTLSAIGSFVGGIRFRADSNLINNLVVNMGSAGATARLGSNLSVAGILSLLQGRLGIAGNMLSLNGNGSTAINGGSSGSYIITGSGGRLGLNIGTGSSATFHVGTDSYYAPMMLTANTGNGSGMLSVGVQDSVRTQGTTGTALSASAKVVNATWFVGSASGTNVNVNMAPMWTSSMEVNGFNHNQGYVSQYINGGWDVTASGSATANSGLYTIPRNNVSSLGPIAVAEDGALKVSASASANSLLLLYPNPASGTLSFTSNLNFTEIAIYSQTGTLVKILQAIDNTVNIESLPSGGYFASFTAKDLTVVRRFTKL